MIALRTHYEGDGEVSKRITLAEESIKEAHYKNEATYPFEKYATRLKQAYTTLEKHGQGIIPQRQVKTLCDGIQVPNSVEMTVAKQHMLDSLRTDFTAAVNYMSLKIAETFPAAVAHAK